MDYSDLGQFYSPLILRVNAKGSNYSQFWTAETPTFYADGEEAAPEDWLGLVRCGVCGRPLPGFKVQVPGFLSSQYADARPSQATSFPKWLGWAWKLSYPDKRHPGRPQEYHAECRLMEDGWSRWDEAQAKVKFDPVYGTKLIEGWQALLQETRNGAFGSGRFSPAARKKKFGSTKPKDKRTPAQRKTKRQIKK